MKIVITQNLVGVDGVFFPVSSGEILPPDAESLHFDEERGEGFIQWKESATTPAEVRDFAREQFEYEHARANNLPLEKLQPRYKSIKVSRPPEKLTKPPFDLAPVKAKWEAAKRHEEQEFERRKPKEAHA